MLAKLGEWRRFAGWIGVMALAAWVLGRGAAGGAVGQMPHVQTAGQEPIRFVTLQQGLDGYAGCEDTELDQWASTTNKSTDDRLRLRSPDIRAVLIRFDLAPIPPQAIITQARLELYVTWGTGGRPINIAGYEMFRPWAVSETTWVSATLDARWGLPGCNDPYSDRSGIPFDEVLVGDVQEWYALDLTYLAQKWHREPHTNRGIILKDIVDGTAEWSFASSESSMTAWRPKLTISYFLPPTPTPTGTSTPGPSATPTYTHTPTFAFVYLPIIFKECVWPVPCRTMTPVPTPTPIELACDDGTSEGMYRRNNAGDWFAARLDPNSHKQVVELGFYIEGEPRLVRLSVYQGGVGPGLERGTPLVTSSPSRPTPGWWWQNVESQNIVVDGQEFYVVFEYMEDPNGNPARGPWIGRDDSLPGKNCSYYGPPLTAHPEGNLMIRARVR